MNQYITRPLQRPSGVGQRVLSQRQADTELMFDLLNQAGVDPLAEVGMLEVSRGNAQLPQFNEGDLAGALEAFRQVGQEAGYQMAPERFGGGGDQVGSSQGFLDNPMLLQGILQILRNEIGQRTGLSR